MTLDSLLHARTVHRPGLPTAKKAESLCLLDALYWIISLGMDHVIFESDAKILVDAVHSKNPDISELGSIVDECKFILQSNQTFKVCFVKRQVSKVDDILTKATCSYVTFLFDL